jgi:hypothetical protein
MSATGECFYIGTTTRAALARFKRSVDTSSRSTDPRTAG